MWLAGQLSPLSICFTDHFRFTQSLCFINRLVPEVNGLGWHSWYSDLLWAGPLRDQSQGGGGGEVLCSPPGGIGDHPAMQWVPGFFQGCRAAGV